MTRTQVKLEFKSLAQHLDKTPTGQYILHKYRSSIQHLLQQGTFPYPPLHRITISELYHGSEEDDKDEKAHPRGHRKGGEMERVDQGEQLRKFPQKTTKKRKK